MVERIKFDLCVLQKDRGVSPLLPINLTKYALLQCCQSAFFMVVFSHTTTQASSYVMGMICC
jgi:hypothetical protein